MTKPQPIWNSTAAAVLSTPLQMIMKKKTFELLDHWRSLFMTTTVEQRLEHESASGKLPPPELYNNMKLANILRNPNHI